MIVDAILEHLRSALQASLIDSLPADDDSRAGYVKIGPYQGDPTPEEGRSTVVFSAYRVVLALGVAPVNDLVPALSGKVPALYAIGDASRPAKIHDAIAAGFDLASRL